MVAPVRVGEHANANVNAKVNTHVQEKRTLTAIKEHLRLKLFAIFLEAAVAVVVLRCHGNMHFFSKFLKTCKPHRIKKRQTLNARFSFLCKKRKGEKRKRERKKIGSFENSKIETMRLL